MYILLCLAVFLLGWGATIVVTSIGYHRALAHGAIVLHPALRRALVVVGPWFTGFDAKTWVVMHRRHHQYSDTPDDPHSPVHTGFLGLFKAQYDAYTTTQNALVAGDPEYTSIGRDLELSWPTRTGRWWAPYLLHAIIGIVVGVGIGWWVALALMAGALSHIVQGGIINYFGHAVGGRNFDLDDNSRNNHLAAWFVLGEGFQNNHHRYPSSARFSYRAVEIDLG
ncbi:MAG TPA: fatty acid desaturase, partial [Myxococcota bacterium]